MRTFSGNSYGEKAIIYAVFTYKNVYIHEMQLLCTAKFFDPTKNGELCSDFVFYQHFLLALKNFLVRDHETFLHNTFKRNPTFAYYSSYFEGNFDSAHVSAN